VTKLIKLNQVGLHIRRAMEIEPQMNIIKKLSPPKTFSETSGWSPSNVTYLSAINHNLVLLYQVAKICLYVGLFVAFELAVIIARIMI